MKDVIVAIEALHALVLPEREAYVGFTCFGRGQSMRLQRALHAFGLSEREAYVGFTCFGPVRA